MITSVIYAIFHGVYLFLLRKSMCKPVYLKRHLRISLVFASTVYTRPSPESCETWADRWTAMSIVKGGGMVGRCLGSEVASHGARKGLGKVGRCRGRARWGPPPPPPPPATPLPAAPPSAATPMTTEVALHPGYCPHRGSFSGDGACPKCKRVGRQVIARE